MVALSTLKTSRGVCNFDSDDGERRVRKLAVVSGDSSVSLTRLPRYWNKHKATGF